MRNSIILPLNYERIFMNELRKSGLIKHVEMPDKIDFDLIDTFNEQMYKRSYKIRQNLFQMILLYDELIIQDFDATYEYDKIKGMSNFKIYPFEDFYYFDPMHEENNSLYAEYLKPAILKYLKKELRSYFEFGNGRSYDKMISELYDLIYKINDNISKETEELLELNELAFKLKHRNNIVELKKLNAPKELTNKLFLTEIVNWFDAIYRQLCWQLKISTEQDSYIINSEFELSKIGCEIYQENINTYMEAYKILKCECSSIIGTLPHMNSIEEAMNLKEKRRNDIKNLREVISNLENVLRTEGKERAITKAVNDVKKASSSLSRCERVSKIGKWTTLLSVPVGSTEMLLGGGFVGLGLSIIGTMTCLIDENLKRNNNWCEIVR